MNPEDTNSKILSMLNSVGLPLQKRPSSESCPELPADMPDLSLHELSGYLQQFTAWAGFASGLEAAAKNEVLVYTSQLAYNEALQITTAVGKTITERKLQASSSPAVRDTEDLLLEAKNRYELLRVTRERLVKYAEAISRQITIVQLEQNNI